MTLPDALSDLFEAAIDDCEAVEGDDRYVLYMFDWHRPGDELALRRPAGDDEPRDAEGRLLPTNRCAVCMAGAMMARRLGAPHDQRRYPESFDHSVEEKLRLVDSFRVGDVLVLRQAVPDDQYEVLYRALGPIKAGFDRSLGRAPWHVYRDAVRMLREAGL